MASPSTFIITITLTQLQWGSVVYCLKGGLRITPDAEVELESPIDPLRENNGIGKPTIEKYLSRRNIEEERPIVIDPDGKYVHRNRLYSQECSESLLMTEVRLNKVISVAPDILENGGIACHWEIIGSGNCVPIISCPNFTLAEPEPNSTENADDGEDGDEEKVKEPCMFEYLELTDGSYGYKKYCGVEGPVNVTTARYRDLYVTLQLGAAGNAKNRVLDCVVGCMDEGDEGVIYLEENSEPETEKACKCGRKSPSPTLRRKREAADNETNYEAKRGEFPWIAALVASGTRKPFCVGSIINDRFILTSAHCLKKDFANISNVEILLHPHELNVTRAVTTMNIMPLPLWTIEELKEKDERESSLRYTVSTYFVHPLFVRQINDFDVALVKLDRPIDFEELKIVAPVCLPDNGQWDQTKEGSTAVVSGWGLKAQAESENSSSILTTLKKQTIEVYMNSECSEAFDWRFSRRMLCAGHIEGNHSCSGDGGSPLIEEKTKSVWEQIGLLAYAAGCVSKEGPALFTDVRQVAQWIRYVSTKEGAVWCSG